MTIDHITWLLYPGCQYLWWVIVLHGIGGGKTQPRSCGFCIAEGFLYRKFCLSVIPGALLSINGQHQHEYRQGILGIFNIQYIGIRPV